MGELYLYRAPLDWLAQRLVAATTHPVRVPSLNRPPGLIPQRVTLRWAPVAGGAIRTQRGLLWTSHQVPLALLSYQQAGAEALLQFRPFRRAQGEGNLLQDQFNAPIGGPVHATASYRGDHLTVRGRVGVTPFLRRLTTPGRPEGRWSVLASAERNQVSLTLLPPGRPPAQARLLSFRGQVGQAAAEPLATGHVALSTTLAMEAEWLDHEGRRRVTDWQVPIRHLLSFPAATPGELLGINLGVEELRWAPDRPVWALLRAQIARYRPSLLPIYHPDAAVQPSPPGWTPAPILIDCTEATFDWTESEPARPTDQREVLQIPCDRPIARLLALDARPGALDLLLGLKGGGLHLLTAPTPWRTVPKRLAAFALPGRISLHA